MAMGTPKGIVSFRSTFNGSTSSSGTAMLRKKPNRLDVVAVAAGQCRCVSGLRTSRDADSSGRAENGERRNVGDSSPLWETTYGNC